MEEYHLEDIYDEQVSPLMKQIIAICKEHKLPMLATFAFENCEERPEHLCTTNLFFDNRTPNKLKDANRTVRSNGHVTMAIVVGKSASI